MAADPEPAVIRPFDPPVMPWDRAHRGVDLAGQPGQVVLAALPGRVGFAGVIAGKPVVASVAPGDMVSAGDPLGHLVIVSSHCFPAACLHWGLRRGETYLDPLSLVGGGPVRLLPLWRDSPTDPLARPWVSALGAWPPLLQARLRTLTQARGCACW